MSYELLVLLAKPRLGDTACIVGEASAIADT